MEMWREERILGSLPRIVHHARPTLGKRPSGSVSSLFPDSLSTGAPSPAGVAHGALTCVCVRPIPIDIPMSHEHSVPVADCRRGLASPSPDRTRQAVDGAGGGPIGEAAYS